MFSCRNMKTVSTCTFRLKSALSWAMGQCLLICYLLILPVPMKHLGGRAFIAPNFCLITWSWVRIQWKAEFSWWSVWLSLHRTCHYYPSSDIWCSYGTFCMKISQPYLPDDFNETVLSKQFRPRSDAAKCGIWSGSTLIATYPAVCNTVTGMV